MYVFLIYASRTLLKNIFSRELGYANGAIETRIVNLVEGENFNPEFIKIVSFATIGLWSKYSKLLQNPHATLPTLVADGKVYKSTVEVVNYLLDNAPKPAGKASGTDLIEQVHRDDIDPNFALLLSVSRLFAFVASKY